MAEWTDVTLELSEKERKRANQGLEYWGESVRVSLNAANEWLEADRFKCEHPILAMFKKGACIHDLKKNRIVFDIMTDSAMMIVFLKELYPDLDLYDMWFDDDLREHRNKIIGLMA